ncbi:MAG: NAD(FAD)-dependent dehydrogenase [Bacteroidetes bacterium]|nr:MAG: NAD(FAD)-dependent dehydrogenase [Bacteroidota bacterium]
MATRTHVVARRDDLQDGEMKHLQAGETDILLARIGGRYFATGAHCTHYGAPLAEGVLSGEEVMCPWHHACFNITTGRQTEPPGMDSLPCFEVEVRGDDVLVHVPEKETGPRVVSMADRDDEDARVFVVLGAGAAGAYAVEAMRAAGYAGRIVLIAGEEFPPVDRPNLSKQYLSGEAPEEWIPLRSPAFYEEHGIEVVEGTVTKVEATTRQLTFADGRVLGYDKLLLCTGGRPRTLSVPGADLPGVYTLRSLSDSRAIRDRAARAQKAVVVGASFIGMEAAWSLQHRGLEVTVVASEAVPFETVFGEEVGRVIQQIHETNGVRFRLGTQVQAIAGTTQVQAVHLSDGTVLETDLVIVGIGVQPATGYLHGVERAEDGSIVVDDHFQAAPDLYAAGDIARFPFWRSGDLVRIEHWRTACQQGRLAGYAMAGQPRPYRGIPFFWTAHFGTSIRYVGHAEAWDAQVIQGDCGDASCLVYYVREGVIQAALGIGRDREMAAIHLLMRQDALPPVEAIRRRDVDVIERARSLASSAA